MWKMNIATEQRYVNTYSPQESHAKCVYIHRFRHLNCNLCKYTFARGNMLAFAALAFIRVFWVKAALKGPTHCTAQPYLAILISTGYLFYRLQIGRCTSLADVWRESVRRRRCRRGGMKDELGDDTCLSWTRELYKMFSVIVSWVNRYRQTLPSTNIWAFCCI